MQEKQEAPKTPNLKIPVPVIRVYCKQNIFLENCPIFYQNHKHRTEQKIPSLNTNRRLEKSKKQKSSSMIACPIRRMSNNQLEK